MKYVKTKDGCITEGNFKLGKKILTVWDEEIITEENSANTIEELCDEFVIDTGNRKYLIHKGAYLGDFYKKDYIIIGDENIGPDCKVKIKNKYGAIWATGEHGEPILKSVAKMNNEGKLELL